MSQRMTTAPRNPGWASPYDGPGYAQERAYLSKIPFKPRPERDDPIRDFFDKPFRPRRDRRMRSIVPQDLRGTLQEMNKLKAAGKFGLLARRFGLGWANLLEAILAELGLSPFDDPWALAPQYDYNLAGHGFELCCKTSDQLEAFAKTRTFRPDGFDPEPCAILPTLWCGTTLQPTQGVAGDPLHFDGVTNSNWQYDVVFFGPSLVGGTRMEYRERWTRKMRGPFAAHDISPTRPAFPMPAVELAPTGSPFIKPREGFDDDGYELPREVGGPLSRGRDLAPYEVPAGGFELGTRGPPRPPRDPHQLLPPGKAREKKRDFNTGLPGKIYGKLTELADFLECAEKALPPGIPRVENKLHLRLQRVYDNFEKIDTAKMTVCLHTNAANDAVVGKYNALANRGLAYARRQGYLGAGRARGIGFGSWGQRMR